MPPFWAELRKLEEEEGLSVLPTDPEGYAEDAEDLNPPEGLRAGQPMRPAAGAAHAHGRAHGPYFRLESHQSAAAVVRGAPLRPFRLP